MARNRVTLIFLAAFVASSTGLLLAVHLHQVHGDHDSHNCDVCIALVSGLLASLDFPLIHPEYLLVNLPTSLVDESASFVSRAHGTFASRAPPLA
jgi:hypothetical protein